MSTERKGFADLMKKESATGIYYAIGPISFSLLESQTLKGKIRYKLPDMPFDALKKGESFKVPLDVAELAIRMKISRLNAKGKAKFIMARLKEFYEIGRIE